MNGHEAEITGWFENQKKLDPNRYPIGIGDDMAQMRLLENDSVLITTDMLLDGTHFDLREHSLEEIGYKAMAVSLSDCAAMASVPLSAVVSVALPKGWQQDCMKELHKGILKAGNMFGCELIGGDITSWSDKSGRFAINVAMLSRPNEHHKPVQRTTAHVGDWIFVTGKLGGSIMGSHLDFIPRVNEALRLTELVEISSMMDLSDGLSTDLNHICRLSKVGAVVNASDIPISDAAKQDISPLLSALNDGEDFELLFTVTPENGEDLISHWDLDCPVTKIGEITDTGKVEIIALDGQRKDLLQGGFDHFGA